MPYSAAHLLPEKLRKILPLHAQEIYMTAFNHAWKEYENRPDRDEISHRVAWSAVKKIYTKDETGEWAKKEE